MTIWRAKGYTGRLFRVLPSGTVLSREKNEELGYIDSSIVDRISVEEIEGIYLDEIVETNIKIPITLVEKTELFFKNLKKNITQRKSKITLPRKIDFLKYINILNEEEQLIIKMLFEKHNIKTISKRIGYNVSYVYFKKSKAIEKIKNAIKIEKINN